MTYLARRRKRARTAPVSRFASAAAEHSRSTSRRCTCTAAMVAPRTASSRSRAIVSTAGRRAPAPRALQPLQVAPADVAPEVAAGEAHAFGVCDALPLRLRDCLAEGGHGGHPPPPPDEGGR